MLVSPLDGPVILVVAAAVAFAYSHWLEPYNTDSYAALKWVVVGLLWAQAVLVATETVEPLVGTATSVDPLVGIAYVLSYPLWFGWVARRVFVVFGRTPAQGGILWPLTLRDRTDSFERSWER